MNPYFNSADVSFITSVNQTPLLVLDIEVVRQQMREFQQQLPGVVPFYSVKTNPHPLILDTLLGFNAHFDVATLGEIELTLSRGVEPGHLLYTHPAKTKKEITKAASLGINAFTLDSLDELQRLAECAPGSHYFIRISTKQNSSLYDYKRKFGATMTETKAILDYARDKHVAVAGISFMVGSQSMSVAPWSEALQTVADLMNEYHDDLPSLRVVNIGSGFPLPYEFAEEVPTLADIAEVIKAERPKFPADVTFIAEPGRYIVGRAGAFMVGIDRKLRRGDKDWLYTDMNAYSGLIEIIESGGKFRYPITSNAAGEPQAFAVVGKTLDPDDILRSEVMLPNQTDEGSILTIHDAGAYSTSFFTTYHSLPQPEIIFGDSKYAANVSLASSNMEITGLKAQRDIAAGETVFQVTGFFTDERTRTSFQVDHARHIEPTLFGAFLNHSCDPNVGVRTNELGHYDVIARRPIAAGEDIAADYAMFEYQTGPMGQVECLCGSDKCRKHITGYVGISDELKKEYEGYFAKYLSEASESAPTPVVYVS